jgi:hypothetical protein
MSEVDTLTGEAADRLAIRGLVDAWARCADRRMPEEQAALFTADGTVIVYVGDPASSEPVQRLQGRAELADALKVLETYDATTHFNGQSTITLDGDRATGETYCLLTTSGSRTGSAPSWSCRSGTSTGSSDRMASGCSPNVN